MDLGVEKETGLITLLKPLDQLYKRPICTPGLNHLSKTARSFFAFWVGYLIFYK